MVVDRLKELCGETQGGNGQKKRFKKRAQEGEACF